MKQGGLELKVAGGFVELHFNGPRGTMQVIVEPEAAIELGVSLIQAAGEAESNAAKEEPKNGR